MRGPLTEQRTDLKETPELFYRDAMIRDRFCYYLIVNQLFSVIARFGIDDLIPETLLIQQFRHFLHAEHSRLDGPAQALVKSLLEDSRLPYKGNLLTRVNDVDELNAELEMAVYTSIANPLRGDIRATPKGSTAALAVEVSHGVA